jgi:urea transporter
MAGENLSVDRSQPEKLTLRDTISPLTGLGQIMFQDSALTGAFFLAGIAVVSPLMAGGAALGAAIGTLTAYACRLDRAEIRDGLYGFNAGLVGIAVLANYEPQSLTFALLAAGAILSTLLTWAMRRRVPFPTYTTPFIVTTWLALYVAKQLALAAVVQPPAKPEEHLDMAAAVIKGISEVMFQANILTGVLFLVGIMLCSWKGAFWAVIGSLVGVLVGVSHNAPEENLSLGLYGYNAALAAMALALYRPSVMLPLIAAMTSIPFTEKFPLLGLPTLTAPFVLASWVIIALDKLDARLYVEPKRAVR